MLTLRQIDNVVQNNLFIIKGWEHERQDRGGTILYTIWSATESDKIPLGVFRVWEWHDGSGRCGWQPLPEITPEQEKLRDFFHSKMVIPLLLQTEKTSNVPSAVQSATTIKPEKNKKILFKGTLPTTPEILYGALHDFWLGRAPSLAGTAIGGLQFELNPFDEFFYQIYIRLGPYNTQMIADIDIRRLNDSQIRITIPSTEGDVTFYRGEEWNDISSATDQFLSGFGTHLKKLYLGNKGTEDAHAINESLQRKKKTVNLQTKPAGRKVDPCNPEAWKIIIDNGASDKAYNKAFAHWCKAKGINLESASKYDRNAFKKAMKRQEKRGGQN